MQIIKQQEDQSPTEVSATAEMLVQWRDERQESWASVAQLAGLGSPGAARRMYARLVRPHTESVLNARVAAKVLPMQFDGLSADAVRTAIAGRTIIVERIGSNEEIAVANVTSVKDGTINFNDGVKCRSVKAVAVVAVK